MLSSDLRDIDRRTPEDPQFQQRGRLAERKAVRRANPRIAETAMTTEMSASRATSGLIETTEGAWTRAGPFRRVVRVRFRFRNRRSTPMWDVFSFSFSSL